ncbi:hypothetical protein GQ55_6G278200 [Panicum hallii var. hallii]|uniref:Secreted protein n=1 Tax=Panicum hallii var. hallii TaxID=1504633 RepID=A0A2T7DAD7_9POAL|nr:hypothetical protein GQ55_6G278200 [Panicum hallii var. hallii]
MMVWAILCLHANRQVCAQVKYRQVATAWSSSGTTRSGRWLGGRVGGSRRLAAVMVESASAAAA